jgi:pSer/pThr/pTyr-binding forkhead associated (FHA) protein
LIEFKQGRGHACEIRVSDISVSRLHAYIKYERDKGFLIVDNNSKFGTLIKLTKPFVIEYDKMAI